MEEDGRDLFEDYLQRFAGNSAHPSSADPPYRSISALIDTFVIFETAARHAGAVEAAGELRLTPEVVRHHLDTLESELGLSLFRPQAGRLELTANGHRLADAVREALRRIAEAVDPRDSIPSATRCQVISLPARPRR